MGEGKSPAGDWSEVWNSAHLDHRAEWSRSMIRKLGPGADIGAQSRSADLIARCMGVS